MTADWIILTKGNYRIEAYVDLKFGSPVVDTVNIKVY